MKEKDEQLVSKVSLVLKFIRAKWKSLLTILGSIVPFTFCIFRFLEYLYCKVKFDFYGIDEALYHFDTQSFILNFLYSIGFTILCIIIAWLYNIIKDINVSRQNHIEKLKNKGKYYIAIFLVNFLFSVVVAKTFNFMVLIYIFIFCFLEWLFWKVLFSEINENEEQCFSNLLADFLDIFIIAIGVFAFFFWLFSNTYYSSIREYRIINNNKAIVYTTEAYYITVDCTVEDNNLIIYKGTQTKINSNNVHSKLKKFNNVQIKNES